MAFFAPDREGIASLPVYEQYDASHGQTLKVGTIDRQPNQAGPRPLFFILPADVKDYTAATLPLYEHQSEGGAGRFYSVDPRGPTGRAALDLQVLGRVWSNPSRLRLW